MTFEGDYLTLLDSVFFHAINVLACLPIFLTTAHARSYYCHRVGFPKVRNVTIEFTSEPIGIQR